MEEDHRVASERVASWWLQAKLRTAKYDPRFLQQMGSQKFRHPETGNQVLFISLPSKEQVKVYRQWAARQQQEDAGKETGEATLKKDQAPGKSKTPSEFADWLGSLVGDRGSSSRRLTRKLKGLAEKGSLDDAKDAGVGINVKSLQGLANKAGLKSGLIPYQTYADAMRDGGRWDDDKHREFMEKKDPESVEMGAKHTRQIKKEREDKKRQKSEEAQETRSKKWRDVKKKQVQDAWQQSEQYRRKDDDLDLAMQRERDNARKIPPGASHDDKRERHKRVMRELERREKENQTAPKDWEPKRASAQVPKATAAVK
jgi:hypothetical protein